MMRNADTKKLTNLPMDLLRTFVTVVDLQGFTRAGSVLGRSQPAVSLQIKRLEQLIRVPLLRRSGKKLLATEEGDTLLRYARQILHLNDETVSLLVRSPVAGNIRLGLPNEFAVSLLPGILGQFSRSHPDVTLEVTCELSTQLLEWQRQKEFDLVMAIHHRPVDRSIRIWTEDLVWVAAPGYRLRQNETLPLVVAKQGCVYRNRIIETLNSAEIPWRIVYTSTSYGGIHAAVLAGLGITVLARSTVPEGLNMLSANETLPPLQPAEVALHYDRRVVSDAVGRLVEYVTANLGHGASIHQPKSKKSAAQ